MAKFISKNIGIDLGTVSTVVYVAGKGIVTKEPSVVAVDRIGKTVAFGGEARGMIGRTPENIIAVKPLCKGVISNYSMTERMLNHYIKKAGGGFILKPSVVVCIPCLASEIEKRAVTDAASAAGARRVRLIKEPVAAAIGAGIDINKPCGRMVVDIGGGSCDIAVISLGGIVADSTIPVAGDYFDEMLVRYIRKKYNILIGDRTAEDIKIRIGTVNENEAEEETTASGLSVVTGLPERFSVTTKDVCTALCGCAEKIIDTIKCVIERTPPELLSDIKKNGILLTGGGSLLRGLSELVEKSTGIPAYVAKDAALCVAKGAGIAAEKGV